MKHAWLYSDPLQALTGEPFSSGFLTDESFISEFAVTSPLDLGQELIDKKGRFLENVLLKDGNGL